MKELKFIVTSTARSGTVYAAKLLTSLGIPCGHESIFNSLGWNFSKEVLSGKHKPQLSMCSRNPRGYTKRNEAEDLNWVNVDELMADCSYVVVPYLHKKELQNIPLLHITREPLSVISSLFIDYGFFSKKTPLWQKSWHTIIQEFIPDLMVPPTQVERVCHFYVKWHEAILDEKNRRPYYCHKIESGPTLELLKFLDVKQLPENYFKERANKGRMDQPTKRKIDLTWNEIPEGSYKDNFIRTCKKLYLVSTVL